MKKQGTDLTFRIEQQGSDFATRLSEHGQELHQRCEHLTKCIEKESAELYSQLISGVEYLHSIGCAHRDLKPENLLLDSEADNANIKVIDFGTSKRFNSKNKKRMT